MVGDYASVRLRRQVRSVVFIVIYLIAFQLLVFGRGPDEAIRVAGGIAAVILGLALFLEGLLLGLLPLAKRVGIRLAPWGGLKIIILIGLLVGVGSTLAEPAVASLRVVGGDVAAWEAPLLFYLLQRNPQLLISAIAVGVGIAVAIGMVRFYVGFSIKPLILVIVPVLLGLSLLGSHWDNLAMILALAWDSGAVTTGPVTVPLILALGIGVARSSPKSDKAGSGFGTVALASIFPVLAVMALGAILQSHLPTPTSEEEFFAPGNRAQAMRLFADEHDLAAHALSRGNEETRRLFLADAQTDHPGGDPAPPDRPAPGGQLPHHMHVLLDEAYYAARSILPLTLLLGLVLIVLLRDRPRYLDELVLGIVFALVGMSLLTAGVRMGLLELGRQTGSRLPHLYGEVVGEDRIVIQDFDPAIVFPAATEEFGTVEVFHLFDGERVHTVRFRSEWYDPQARVYTHHIQVSPLIHPQLSRIGVLLILIFAFGMGYGTTIAEPALQAMGQTVEDVTVGTVRGVSVVRVVSIGVGIGLVLGFIRMLYAIPIVWMIVPPYLLLLPLTLLSDEEFVGIAWDSGGVTTGPVTVPLVMAMGLSLGSQLGLVDAFGLLAMASVYPILTLLLFGLITRRRERRVVRAAEGSNGNA